jgi:hypothetical protein
MSRELKQAATKVQALQTNSGAPATASNTPKSGMASALAKMMDNPESRKFIRQQQRMILDQMYAPLVKQMGMTEAEATEFKDVLADRMMASAQKAMSAMSEAGQGSRAEAMQKLTAEQQEFDAGVRELLGEERYAQYKEYQLTVGERVQLNMFRQQTAGTPGAIEEAQVEKLLAVMREEKLQQTTPDGAPINEEQVQRMALGSPEQTDRLINIEQSLNERVHARAGEVLDPAQLESFKKFQDQQLQTLRMSLAMARTMFGGEETPSPPEQRP